MINCMNKNCCSCASFVSTESVTQVGDLLELDIDSDIDLTNNKQLCIRIAQNIPQLTGIPRVVITQGANTHNIIQTQYCEAPHFLYADQLKRDCNGGLANRQTISLIFAEDSMTFSYNGCRRLCRTNAVITPVLVTPSNMLTKR